LIRQIKSLIRQINWIDPPDQELIRQNNVVEFLELKSCSPEQTFKTEESIS